MSISSIGQSSSVSSLYDMQIKKKEKEQAEEKLSSGYQINSAADDPAGLAISEKMRNQITTSKAASTNASMAQAMTKVSEGAMSEVSTMINRATELAAQGSNGTYTEVERGAIQDELTAISDEISRIASSTNFNGIPLLQGGTINLQIGADSASYNSISIDLGSISTQFAETFDASTMQATTQEQTMELLDQLKEFVNKISSERADSGATYNRLDYTKNNLSSMVENLQSAESIIRDTDMAKEATEASKSSLGFRAATAAAEKEKEEKAGILNLLT